jgi:hypothetical protein
MKSLRYYLFTAALCCSTVLLRAMEKEKSIEQPGALSLVGTSTMGAMEKEMNKKASIEELVVYCLNRSTDHCVSFYPQVLYAKLERLRRVGKEDSYALVYLKEVVSGFPTNSMWCHRLFMLGNEYRYMKIFKDTGVADKNNAISSMTRRIANIAIEVEERNVIVATPAWFETRRVAPQDTSVVAKTIVPEVVVSDADANAEIGGVVYGDGLLKVISHEDSSSSSDNK